MEKTEKSVKKEELGFRGQVLGGLKHGILFPLFCILFPITCPLSPVPSSAVELPYRNPANRNLLLQAAHDEDRVNRCRAAEALAAVPDEQNQPILAELSLDPVAAVRLAAQGTNSEIKVSSPGPQNGFNPRPEVDEKQVSENHRDPRVRQMVRLRKLDSDPAFKEDFSGLLDDPDYFVRRAVSTEVIQKRGESSLKTWQKLLNSERLDDRIEAAWALGKLKSKADETTLLGFIAQDSERLRLISVDSLHVIGGDATCQALGDALLKSNGKTQEALLRLAAHLMAKQALPTLRTLAEDKNTGMESRYLALDAIGIMTDTEAKPFLIKIVEDFNIDPSYSKLREHAARALGALGDLEAVPPLKKLIVEKVLVLPFMGAVFDSDATRIACIQALQQLKETAVLSSFINQPFLSESSEGILRALSDALTALTGAPYDYRHTVTFHSWFMESLDSPEYPPDLDENLKQPPVFASKSGKGK